MAKRGILDHPKTLRLAARLRIPECYAVGILECLWQWTAEYAPTGDLSACSASDLARAIRFKGKPQTLVGALNEVRFLDASPGLVAVHDWDQHAPDYVHLRLARALSTFWNGAQPSLARMSRQERDEIMKARESASVRTGSAQEAHGSAPPGPGPGPGPEPVPEPTRGEGGGRDEPAAPATLPPPEDLELIHHALCKLSSNAEEYLAELRTASFMPAKKGHRERWATRLAELSGKWARVTLSRLEQRLADVEAAQPAPSEPDLPTPDPQADAAWTQVLDELTLAERAGVKAPSPQSVARWLRPLVPVAIEPGRLYLASPSAEHRRLVPSTYGPAVAAAAARLELTVLLDHAVMGQQAQEVP